MPQDQVPATQSPALRLEGLELRRAGRTLFAGLDLDLARGERLLLRGPSGSGKTSLLRCLLGFARPAVGRILIEGEELDGRSVWRLRRRLAYVAQEPDLGEGTVAALLARPAGLRANADRADDAGGPERLLAELNLHDGLRRQRVEDLSGGERQRLALAIALWLARPILLLDEPSSALDEESTAAVLDALAVRGDLAVLAVAHDPAWAAIADRTVDLSGHRPAAATGAG